MSEPITRESPVRFEGTPLATEQRDNWTVTLAYEEEGPGPWLVDLSHHPRWDLQDGRIDTLSPVDINVPSVPGGSVLENQFLVNRMNATQAAVWHLGTALPAMPDAPGYTDVSEASLCLALLGPNVLSIAERLTPLDLCDPKRQAPFLIQGPVCRVPCQIVVLQKRADGGGGLIMTCSRGYGDSMVAAIFKAGEAFDLHPAGENRFTTWLDTLSG